MSIFYVETSTLLRLLFREDGWKDLQNDLARSTRLFSSRLVKVEVERAILRVVVIHQENSGKSAESEKLKTQLQGELRSLLPKLDLIEISKEICDSAGCTASKSLIRSLDAIHLASYDWIKAKIPATRMLSFDRRILTLLH